MPDSLVHPGLSATFLLDKTNLSWLLITIPA